MKSKQEFAAFIGIDWADAKHDLCLRAADTKHTESMVLEHDPETLDTWARGLRLRFGGKPIAICLELDKGPLVYALRKYDFIVLFPINPSTLAKYRAAMTPSGAKDDPTDAALALDFLTKHPERLEPLNPQSPAIRALEQLVEYRRRLVNDQTRITNRLTSTLKNYFPQPLQWLGAKNTFLFCDFFQRWPTLKAVQLARPATLERFFCEHHVRDAKLIDQRIQAIKAATALTHDAGVITPNALLVQALASQLRVLLKAIADFDQAIAEHATTHPDYALFNTLPGAGAVMAPRLLVAFGEQRQRYRNADELQKYAGIAPVTERSGNTSWVHWRWQCPTFLRQTFVEWAGQTIQYSFWARAYYQQHRERGNSHHAAVRALAFKWIRIVFRCWHNRVPYDESTYLRALKRRGSPLLHNLAKAV